MSSKLQVSNVINNVKIRRLGGGGGGKGVGGGVFIFIQVQGCRIFGAIRQVQDFRAGMTLKVTVGMQNTR